MTDLEIKMMPQRESKRTEAKKNRTKESPVDLTSDEEREFMPDDIVWAKIVGYPWWPAKVTAKSYPRYIVDAGNSSYKKKEVTYCVEFFGEAAHAYLDDSKVAEYSTNRDYFIDLAKRQHRKYNVDCFKNSVKSADLMCQNPDVVSDSQSIISTPKKAKQKIDDEKISQKGKKYGLFQEFQEKIKRKKRIHSSSKDSEKSLSHPSLADIQAYSKLSKLILRLLLQKNKKKFSAKLLKKVILYILKKQKCLRKIKSNTLKDVLSLMNCLKSMTIDEIIEKYEKKQSFLTQERHKQDLQQQNTDKPSVLPAKSSSIYSKYIYVDQLGNQSICSLPLKRYDFYIDYS